MQIEQMTSRDKTLTNVAFHSVDQSKLPHEALQSIVICGDYLCTRLDGNRIIKVINMKQIMAQSKGTEGQFLDYSPFTR